ncbi:hypothetical protein KR093_001747 [Drosophila rubida]|uniref:Citrate transporter-like domain-containing protein n=1 Tax=Drosophila rubida TaxID=30044 RepID=A0AAD4K676_9MUSC|nr:hypothetical protein KR093_001747 [Drosophila rubida]
MAFRSHRPRHVYFFNGNHKSSWDRVRRNNWFSGRWLELLKLIVLLAMWLIFTLLIILTPERHTDEVVVELSPKTLEWSPDFERPPYRFVRLLINGAVDGVRTRSHNAKKSEPFIGVIVHAFDEKANRTLWKSREWKIYMDFEATKDSQVEHVFKMKVLKSQDFVLQVSLFNPFTVPIGLSMTVIPNSMNPDNGIVFGTIILIMLYVLLIINITYRTFVAIFMATTAVSLLSLSDARPSVDDLGGWIGIEMLMLLFGMMLLVEGVKGTGVFDYLSVFAYQLSRGRYWRLFFFLVAFSAISSAILDTVAMVLVMLPVTIRLSEILKLNTMMLLLAIAAFSNLGGALTPIGDPSMAIIASNEYVVDHGITFGVITLHMFPGIFIAMIVIYFLFYLLGRKLIYTTEVDKLQRAIESMEDRLRKGDILSEEEREHLRSRIHELRERLRDEQSPDFETTLARMKRKYRITDSVLLIKCGISLAATLIICILHSLPSISGIKLCWASYLGALLMLILINRADADALINSVDWGMLLYFGALFVLVECLLLIGLVDWMSDLIVCAILKADNDNQLAVAIVVLLWVTTLFSSVVDNVPIASLMLKVTITLNNSPHLQLPFTPLIWALSYGVALGGNGTLAGASISVVTFAVAKEYGYTRSFLQYLAIGVPFMLITMIICTFYLLVAHCVFHWH